MKAVRMLPGIAGLLLVVVTVCFTIIHPTDFVVLRVLVNGAFLLLGCYFIFGIGGGGKPELPSFRTQLLLLRVFFVLTVMLVNMLIHNELFHARILSDPLRKILSLQGKSYEWQRKQFPDENFPEGRVTGVIAQEIEKVLPELVARRRDGYKGVAYQEIVPILIEAVKEQQKTIDNQKKQIAEIRVMLQGLKK